MQQEEEKSNQQENEEENIHNFLKQISEKIFIQQQNSISDSNDLAKTLKQYQLYFKSLGKYYKDIGKMVGKLNKKICKLDNLKKQRIKEIQYKLDSELNEKMKGILEKFGDSCHDEELLSKELDILKQQYERVSQIEQQLLKNESYSQQSNEERNKLQQNLNSQENQELMHNITQQLYCIPEIVSNLNEFRMNLINIFKKNLNQEYLNQLRDREQEENNSFNIQQQQQNQRFHDNFSLNNQQQQFQGKYGIFPSNIQNNNNIEQNNLENQLNNQDVQFEQYKENQQQEDEEEIEERKENIMVQQPSQLQQQTLQNKQMHNLINMNQQNLENLQQIRQFLDSHNPIRNPFSNMGSPNNSQSNASDTVSYKNKYLQHDRQIQWNIEAESEDISDDIQAQQITQRSAFNGDYSFLNIQQIYNNQNYLQCLNNHYRSSNNIQSARPFCCYGHSLTNNDQNHSPHHNLNLSEDNSQHTNRSMPTHSFKQTLTFEELESKNLG